MPLYGNELTVDISPYEAGLGQLVKLDKNADFVGRASLQRQSQLAVTRVRVGLKAEGRRAPRAGQEVHSSLDGPVVGQVTSGVPSPTLGHPIAMAYIDTDLAEAGTSLYIDIRGRLVPAEVVTLPFYRRAQ